MKLILIGAALFIGGALLLLNAMVNDFYGICGGLSALVGAVVLVRELYHELQTDSKEEKQD